MKEANTGWPRPRRLREYGYGTSHSIHTSYPYYCGQRPHIFKDFFRIQLSPQGQTSLPSSLLLLLNSSHCGQATFKRHWMSFMRGEGREVCPLRHNMNADCATVPPRIPAGRQRADPRPGECYNSSGRVLSTFATCTDPPSRTGHKGRGLVVNVWTTRLA